MHNMSTTSAFLYTHEIPNTVAIRKSKTNGCLMLPAIQDDFITPSPARSRTQGCGLSQPGSVAGSFQFWEKYWILQGLSFVHVLSFVHASVDQTACARSVGQTNRQLLSCFDQRTKCGGFTRAGPWTCWMKEPRQDVRDMLNGSSKLRPAVTGHL